MRELENVLQRAIILSRGTDARAQRSVACRRSRLGAAPASATLTDVERRHIVRVLDDVRWRIEGAGGAAQVLGMKPSTLRSRMLKLGIARPR